MDASQRWLGLPLHDKRRRHHLELFVEQLRDTGKARFGLLTYLESWWRKLGWVTRTVDPNWLRSAEGTAQGRASPDLI